MIEKDEGRAATSEQKDAKSAKDTHCHIFAISCSEPRKGKPEPPKARE